jgi:hypothetical protein
MADCAEDPNYDHGLRVEAMTKARGLLNEVEGCASRPERVRA